MGYLDTQLHRLFLDHDCVVVPGLGGFVCNQMAARYDASRQELIPPSRGILFNERLSQNDGVLAQTVVRRAGLSYSEALKAIESEASELKRRVMASQTVNIEHVGRMYLGKEGGIMFMPEEELERMLRSFGLQRIPLRPLKTVTNPTTARVLEMPPRDAIKGSKQWIRIAAAIAIPVLGGAGMFVADNWEEPVALMSAVPSMHNRVIESDFQPRFEEEAVLLSGIKTEPVFESVMQASEGASVTRFDFTTERVSSTGTAVVLAAVEEKSSAIQEQMIVLVAGAFAVESNAMNLSAKLQTEGFSSEILLQESGLHLVTYASFQSEVEARKTLTEIRKDDRWSSAWMKRFKANG